MAFNRSLAVKSQWRDRYGRWVEMGRGVRFYNPATGKMEIGTFTGADADGNARIKLPNGKYITAPQSAVESYSVKGRLSDAGKKRDAQKKASLGDTETKPFNPFADSDFSIPLKDSNKGTKKDVAPGEKYIRLEDDQLPKNSDLLTKRQDSASQEVEKLHSPIYTDLSQKKENRDSFIDSLAEEGLDDGDSPIQAYLREPGSDNWVPEYQGQDIENPEYKFTTSRDVTVNDDDSVYIPDAEDLEAIANADHGNLSQNVREKTDQEVANLSDPNNDPLAGAEYNEDGDLTLNNPSRETSANRTEPPAPGDTFYIPKDRDYASGNDTLLTEQDGIPASGLITDANNQNVTFLDDQENEQTVPTDEFNVTYQDISSEEKAFDNGTLKNKETGQKATLSEEDSSAEPYDADEATDMPTPFLTAQGPHGKSNPHRINNDSLPEDTVEVNQPQPDTQAPQSQESPLDAFPDIQKNTPEALPGEKFAPTQEQQNIIDSVLSGKDVRVQALAGSGKTSTLEALSRRIQKDEPDSQAIYIAFNKSVQTEAEERMPSNVEPRTGHSLAHAWARTDSQGKNILDKIGGGKGKKKETLKKNSDIAKHLNIKKLSDTNDSQYNDNTEKDRSSTAVTSGVVETVKNYQSSSDDDINTSHLPERFSGLNDEHKQAIVDYANDYWNDMLSSNGKVPVTHDTYRKAWALSKPDLRDPSNGGGKKKANILYIDEAQDTPPVLAKVVADQDMRKVVVGDANQAIYGFTGATDYLSEAEADLELPLTQSFRFGPAIADAGNRFLQMLGAKNRVKGGGPESSIVNDMQDPDAILVRSNRGLIKEALNEMSKGKKITVPAGTKKNIQSLVDTSLYLKGSMKKKPYNLHEDLEAYNSWEEVIQEADQTGNPGLKNLTNLIDQMEIDGQKGISALWELRKKMNGIKEKNSVTDNVELTRQGDTLTFRDRGGKKNWNSPTEAMIKDMAKSNGAYAQYTKGQWAQYLDEIDKQGGLQSRGWDKNSDGTWTFTGTDAQLDEEYDNVKFDLLAEGDVTISTAHKSKGLEWDRVKIGDDFGEPEYNEDTEEMEFPSKDELMLDYVSVTRAKKELDPGGLAWIYDYTDDNGGAPDVDAPSVPDDEKEERHAQEVENSDVDSTEDVDVAFMEDDEVYDPANPDTVNDEEEEIPPYRDEMMKIEDLDKIKMDKILNEEYVDDLSEQIKKDGLGDNYVIVEETNTDPFVSDGHHFMEAARRAGHDEVPVRIYSNTPEGKKEALRDLVRLDKEKDSGASRLTEKDEPEHPSKNIKDHPNGTEIFVHRADHLEDYSYLKEDDKWFFENPDATGSNPTIVMSNEELQEALDQVFKLNPDRITVVFPEDGDEADYQKPVAEDQNSGTQITTENGDSYQKETSGNWRKKGDPDSDLTDGDMNDILSDLPDASIDLDEPTENLQAGDKVHDLEGEEYDFYDYTMGGEVVAVDEDGNYRVFDKEHLEETKTNPDSRQRSLNEPPKDDDDNSPSPDLEGLEGPPAPPEPPMPSTFPGDINPPGDSTPAPDAGAPDSPAEEIGTDTPTTPTYQDNHENLPEVDELSEIPGKNYGSNPGGYYEDPETGRKFYVKEAKTQNHASNEALASSFYSEAGIPNAEQHKVQFSNGKYGTVSELIPDADSDLVHKLNDEDYLSKLREGFAMDAFLENWDVVGLVYDNVVSDSNGDPVRVDPGGALVFRAQGAPKGNAFSDEADAWDSLRDPDVNSKSAAVFEGISDQEMFDSAKHVARISDERIDELVDAQFGEDSPMGDELKSKLKNRRQDIIDRANDLGLGDVSEDEEETSGTTDPDVETFEEGFDSFQGSKYDQSAEDLGPGYSDSAGYTEEAGNALSEYMEEPGSTNEALRGIVDTSTSTDNRITQIKTLMKPMSEQYSESTWRGLVAETDNEQRAQMFEALDTPGGMIMDGGFMSTSSERSVAENFAELGNDLETTDYFDSNPSLPNKIILNIDTSRVKGHVLDYDDLEEQGFIGEDEFGDEAEILLDTDTVMVVESSERKFTEPTEPGQLPQEYIESKIRAYPKSSLYDGTIENDFPEYFADQQEGAQDGTGEDSEGLPEVEGPTSEGTGDDGSGQEATEEGLTLTPKEASEDVSTSEPGDVYIIEYENDPETGFIHKNVYGGWNVHDKNGTQTDTDLPDDELVDYFDLHAELDSPSDKTRKTNTGGTGFDDWYIQQDSPTSEDEQFTPEEGDIVTLDDDTHVQIYDKDETDDSYVGEVVDDSGSPVEGEAPKQFDETEISHEGLTTEEDTAPVESEPTSSEEETPSEDAIDSILENEENYEPKTQGSTKGSIEFDSDGNPLDATGKSITPGKSVQIFKANGDLWFEGTVDSIGADPSRVKIVDSTTGKTSIRRPNKIFVQETEESTEAPAQIPPKPFKTEQKVNDSLINLPDGTEINIHNTEESFTKNINDQGDPVFTKEGEDQAILIEDLVESQSEKKTENGVAYSDLEYSPESSQTSEKSQEDGEKPDYLPENMGVDSEGFQYIVNPDGEKLYVGSVVTNKKGEIIGKIESFDGGNLLGKRVKVRRKTDNSFTYRQPNMLKLYNDDGQAPEEETSQEATPTPTTGEFEVLSPESQGASGDGYHASGPWGKFGASGMMIQATDPETGETKYLLAQKSLNASNNPGSWYLPGGALNENETPQQGAAREVAEEVGLTQDNLNTLSPMGETIFDNGKGWSYTNIAVQSPEMFDASPADNESNAMQWFTEDELQAMKGEGDLLPTFEKGIDDLLAKFKSSDDNETVEVVEDPEAGEGIDESTDPAVDPLAWLVDLMEKEAPKTIDDIEINEIDNLLPTQEEDSVEAPSSESVEGVDFVYGTDGSEIKVGQTVNWPSQKKTGNVVAIHNADKIMVDFDGALKNLNPKKKLVGIHSEEKDLGEPEGKPSPPNTDDLDSQISEIESQNNSMYDSDAVFADMENMFYNVKEHSSTQEKLENAHSYKNVGKALIEKKGTTESLMSLADTMHSKKYLSDEMHAQIKEQLESNKAQADSNASALEELQSQKAEAYKKYNEDLFAWKVDEGLIKPGQHTDHYVPVSVGNQVSDDPSSWGQSVANTSNLDSALQAMDEDKLTGSNGVSIMLDSDQVVMGEMRVNKFTDSKGDMKNLSIFQLTGGSTDDIYNAFSVKFAGQIETDAFTVKTTKKQTDGSLVEYDSDFQTFLSGSETSTLTLPDGTEIKISRGDSKESYSTFSERPVWDGRVEIRTASSGGSEDIQKALETIGLKKTAPSSKEDIRRMAAVELFHQVKGIPDDHKKDSPSDADLNKFLKSVEKSHGLTLNDMQISRDNLGFNHFMLTKEGYAKLQQKYDNLPSYYTHSTYNGSPVGVISSDLPGVVSTNKRWTSGIQTNGMSSKADMGTGGATQAFLRPKREMDSYNQIYFRPDVINRLLGGSYDNSDKYGRYRKGLKKWEAMNKTSEYKSNAESNILNGLDISSFWFYRSISEGQRQDIIDELKSKGTYEINGIPVDQFIIGPHGVPPQLDDLVDYSGDYNATPMGPGGI